MLRKLVPILSVALLLAACDRGPTESRAPDNVSMDVLLESADQGASATGFLGRAPAGLQLTAEQRAAIRTINERFTATHRADLDALAAITREAITAQRNGATPDAIRAILERSRPIRERLTPAFAQLARELNAVLTDAQRAWLAENARRHGAQLPPLPPRRA
jgi:Spy/CpxP family protein refolding chaperone